MPVSLNLICHGPADLPEIDPKGGIPSSVVADFRRIVASTWAEFVLDAGVADLKAFDFAEPAFAFGLDDAGLEIVADLFEPAALRRVRP